MEILPSLFYSSKLCRTLALNEILCAHRKLPPKRRSTMFHQHKQKASEQVHLRAELSRMQHRYTKQFAIANEKRRQSIGGRCTSENTWIL